MQIGNGKGPFDWSAPPETDNPTALVIGPGTEGIVQALHHRGWPETAIEVHPDWQRRKPDEQGSSADGVDLLIVVRTLEFLRDDDEAIQTFASRLRPGSRFVLQVPAGDRLGRFDAYNLYRYAQEFSGRGTVPSELKVLGWRRHYHPEELAELLTTAGLEVVHVRRAGLGLTELSNLGVLTLFRLGLENSGRDERLRQRLHRLTDWEARLPLPLGPVLTTMAVRRSE